MPNDVEKVTPPHSPKAEQSLIGSVLCDPPMMDEVGQVRPMDFYSVANQAIWQTLQSMHIDGETLDLVLLIERMKANKSWQRVKDGNLLFDGLYGYGDESGQRH